MCWTYDSFGERHFNGFLYGSASHSQTAIAFQAAEPEREFSEEPGGPNAAE
jgi:hypothetical protein